MKQYFNNARIIDPYSGFDGIGSLLVENGLITQFNKNKPSSKNYNDVEIIECNKLVLCPGIIDLSVSTGEPGSEHKETINSATKAAAAGGITTIAIMPDTKPIIDDISLVEFIIQRAKNVGIINVLPMASLTKNCEGEYISEIGLLSEAGAIAFCDGYKSIGNANVMKRLLSYSKNFNALIAHHIEVPELKQNGVMNEGEISTRLGLEGITSVSEVIMLDRDIHLLKLFEEVRYHAISVSTYDSVQSIRKAKRNLKNISASVAPYHFLLNDSDVIDYKTFAKLLPPLRSEKDRLGIIEGIKDGTIEAISSHHRPETQEKKRLPFANAKFGASGLDTLLTLSLSLYHNEHMKLIEVIDRLTLGPSKILNIPSGKLAEGSPADLLLFDPDFPRKINKENFISKSKNSPFDKRPIQGKVIRTIVSGKTVYPFKEK